MRIEYMIREDESNSYFNKFFPELPLKKVRRKVKKNLNFGIRV